MTLINTQSMSVLASDQTALNHALLFIFQALTFVALATTKYRSSFYYQGKHHENNKTTKCMVSVGLVLSQEGRGSILIYAISFNPYKTPVN